MARYNEILAGRINRFIQKHFAMKGGPPAPQLSGDIQVSFPLFSGVENRFLENWNRYARETVIGAVAAQFSILELRVPVSANIVAVVEKISFENTLSEIPTISLQPGTTTDLSSIVSSMRLDGRMGGTAGVFPQGSAILSQGSAAAFPGTPILVSGHPANSSSEFIIFEDQELVVTNGDALFLTGGIVNQQTVVAIVWRERFLEDSERT